jgi:polyferredoxin
VIRAAAAGVVLMLALWGAAASPRVLLAQPPPSPGAPAAAPAPAAQPGSWQFDDEKDDTPGWREMVWSQAGDLAGFAAFTVLALVSFFRKSVKLKYATFVVCVVYLGFVKSQLISIVNVFALLDWNLPVFRYSMAWYLLAVFTVVATVLWGRLYCGRMCAFGALTQLMDAVVPAKWRRELPDRWDHRILFVKYGVLAFAIVYFLVTRDRFVYRYIEPFWFFSFHANAVMWIMLGVLLTATIFVRNLYCRYLCPVGAALGLISNLTIFKIKRWKECNTCKICEKTCEWGAIRGPKIVKSECVRCDDCERLYMDQKKCPHWIILLKKQGGKLVPAGGQSAAPSATPVA